MRTTLLAAASLCLAACATLKYQEPLQGPRARVRFVTSSDLVAVLRAYDDVNCSQNETEWMRLRNGPLVNPSPKKLGMPMAVYNENAAKEVYVDASRPMHGMFYGAGRTGSGVYSCAVPFTFAFAAGTDYEVKFAATPGVCQVTVARFVPYRNDWTLQELARIDNRVNAANIGCLDTFRKLRLY